MALLRYTMAVLVLFNGEKKSALLVYLVRTTIITSDLVNCGARTEDV